MKARPDIAEHACDECGKPCSPYAGCDECEAYWNRMRKNGFWVDGQGWTDLAIREAMK